jgi:hypothetical protein
MWILVRDQEHNATVLLNGDAIRRIVCGVDKYNGPWTVRVEHIGGGPDTILYSGPSEEEARKYEDMMRQHLEKSETIIDFS